jgi:hypothetical protein
MSEPTLKLKIALRVPIFDNREEMLGEDETGVEQIKYLF